MRPGFYKYELIIRNFQPMNTSADPRIHRDVMLIVTENGHGDPSSNPG